MPRKRTVMGDEKRTRLQPFDIGQFFQVLCKIRQPEHWFRERCLITFLLATAVIFIPVSSNAYPTNPDASDSGDSVGEAPVVLNIVPKTSEFKCIACVIWFMCISVRMSATEGEFETIPTNVNGNSKGFITIDTDTLKTVNERVAKKIKETYLETEKYPEISFSLNDLRGEQENILLPQRNRFGVSGTLRLHGVEKEIVFYPDIFLDDDMISFQGETAVDLTDFNIKIPRFLFLKVKDEISIRFNVAWDYSPLIRNASMGVIEDPSSQLE
jgi:polyisoprenoid-binding protein YceI